MPDKAPKKIASLIGFPLFIIAMLAVFWIFRADIMTVIRDREALRGWILGWGWAGSLAFILLQAFQVIVFIVPGEIVQVAGGWIFGLWPSVGLSIVGIGLGSLVNFAAGRILGRPFVVSLFGEEKVDHFEKVAEGGKAAAGFFLLFVIPGIPKDILCYVAGLTTMRFGAFLAISLAGRFPGILGSAWIGAATQRGDFRAAIAIIVVASVLFILGLVFRERIVAAIGRIIHRRGSAKAEKPGPGEAGPG
ncbi:MAG TPA: VTT domain-containing protein [Rectinemataceae bacterium]|nr:VTT domain-containing protein [Rectinemataceae bacterium]